ncbi:break repair meiotic recombinase recruitment factor 1 [Apteryx mantelli]|uniref:Break repair meiotic recombinase recruitment factor 1 n=1 Tax=Apteryx mantelli TaxID=2696672 RepID=A0ABM4G0N1_9AVES
MSKRKNGQGPGDSECQVSEAKRSFREDPEGTEGLDATGQAEITDSKGEPKPAMGEAEEREEKDQGSTESSEANSPASSSGDGKAAAMEGSQPRQFTSVSSSQNSAGKFVPVFTKPKEASAEKRRRHSGVAPRSRTEQEGIDCNPQRTDTSPERKPPAAATQEARSQAEAPEQANLIAVNREEDRSGATLECQGSVCEELDKPQTCHRTENISDDPETNLELPEQQGEGAACRLQEAPCENPSLIEAPSVFPGVPDQSAGSSPGGSLSGELPERHREEELNSDDQAEGRGRADHGEALLRAPGGSAEQSKPDAASRGWVKDEGSGEDVNGEQQSATETEGKTDTTENTTGSSLKGTAAAEENDSPAREPAENQSVSPVCPEAESVSHLPSCGTSLPATSCQGDADRGRGEAEEGGIPPPGTSSASEPNSAVPIPGASVRKQEDLPEERKENGSEKARPSKEHSGLSAGEPGLEGLGEEPPSTGVPQGEIRILGAEGKAAPCSRAPRLGGENAKDTALAGETAEPVPSGSALPASRAPAQLEKEGATAGCAEKPDANSGDGKRPSAADGDSPADTDPEDKTCSTAGDEPSRELALLPDGHLQADLKDSGLAIAPQQPFSADSKGDPSVPEREPCAEGGQSHCENGFGDKNTVLVADLRDPDEPQPSAEVTEGIHEPSQKEDATDVVCGLIAELSNLNRLIMSAHRDLESLKRLKYRKSRRSGKFPPHPPRGAPTSLTTRRKRKDP